MVVKIQIVVLPVLTVSDVRLSGCFVTMHGALLRGPAHKVAVRTEGENVWSTLRKVGGTPQRAVVISNNESYKILQGKCILGGSLEKQHSRLLRLTHTFPKKGSFPGGHRERRSLRQVWPRPHSRGLARAGQLGSHLLLKELGSHGGL